METPNTRKPQSTHYHERVTDVWSHLIFRLRRADKAANNLVDLKCGSLLALDCPDFRARRPGRQLLRNAKMTGVTSPSYVT